MLSPFPEILQPKQLFDSSRVLARYRQFVHLANYTLFLPEQRAYLSRIQKVETKELSKSDNHGETAGLSVSTFFYSFVMLIFLI